MVVIFDQTPEGGVWPFQIVVEEIAVDGYAKKQALEERAYQYHWERRLLRIER